MNKERLINQMNQERVDALIAVTHENVGYLTNFWTQHPGIGKGISLFSNSMDKPVLIASLVNLISSAESINTKELKLLPFGSFYVYGDTIISETDQKIEEILQLEKKRGATEALINMIKEENLEGCVIGIENPMPFQLLHRLKEEFPKLRIKGATDLFYKVRMVKTSDEIEKLKKSAAIIEKATKSVLQNITEGITEKEAAGELHKEIASEGATPGLTAVCFGATGAHIDNEPTGNRLKRGDVIRIDAGCVWKHYHSDIAKTIVFGKEPTAKQQKYFNALVNGQRSGIVKAKAGVRASDIFDEMVETVRKDIPHYNRHHCGHGMGLEIEPPSIASDDNTLLEKGMVVNLEAPYYELGLGGLQVEDTLLITETGNKVLTHPQTSTKV